MMTTGAQIDKVTDVVVFALNDGVTREQFLATGHAVSQWARSQPGFVSRDLSYSAEQDKWIEVVSWANQAQADAAMVAEQAAPECLPMFALIEMASLLHLRGTAAIEPVGV